MRTYRPFYRKPRTHYQGPQEAISSPYLLKGLENMNARSALADRLSLIFPCCRALVHERHNRCTTVERSLIGAFQIQWTKSGA